jgi:hypothetical protein
MEKQLADSKELKINQVVQANLDLATDMSCL